MEKIATRPSTLAQIKKRKGSNFANWKHCSENPQAMRQRVVLFGDSWFERFTYEGRNNGVGPFEQHVRSCADQGHYSVMALYSGH